MAALINVETSTEVCSVALSLDGKVVWHKENFDGQSHSVSLAKFIEELMDYAKKANLNIDGVAVSCGRVIYGFAHRSFHLQGLMLWHGCAVNRSEYASDDGQSCG